MIYSPPRAPGLHLTVLIACWVSLALDFYSLLPLSASTTTVYFFLSDFSPPSGSCVRIVHLSVHQNRLRPCENISCWAAAPECLILWVSAVAWWKFAFLSILQALLVLLVWGPPLENHWCTRPPRTGWLVLLPAPTVNSSCPTDITLCLTLLISLLSLLVC